VALVDCGDTDSVTLASFPQVYTYLLRPLTAPGRVQGGNDPVTTQQQLQHQLDDTSTSTTDQQAQLQLARQSRGMTASRQGSGDDAVVTGYELQLVMEYCPLVSERMASWGLIDCTAGSAAPNDSQVTIACCSRSSLGRSQPGVGPTCFVGNQ
jgi:hypothetical protein